MEIVFEAMARAHSRLARKRVLGDLKALTRDAQDLIKATVGDLRVTFEKARSQSGCATAVVNHPYECLGAALGFGILVGVVISRK